MPRAQVQMVSPSAFGSFSTDGTRQVYNSKAIFRALGLRLPESFLYTLRDIVERTGRPEPQILAALASVQHTDPHDLSDPAINDFIPEIPAHGDPDRDAIDGLKAPEVPSICTLD